MNKKELESKLRNSLDVFLSSVQEEEVSYYLHLVNEQKKNGLSEEDAVKSLGPVEDIIQNIYLKHGVDYKKTHKEHGFVYQKFSQLFESIHKLVDVMGENDLKSNAKIIVNLLILFIFIALLKIPFIVVQNLGDSLFSYITIPILADIWSFIMDLIYIVVAVMAFINIFNKYFSNLKVEKKPSLKKKGLESINLEEQVKAVEDKESFQ